MSEGYPRFEKEPQPRSPEELNPVSRVLEMSIDRRGHTVFYKLQTAEGEIREKSFKYMGDNEMNMFAAEMRKWIKNGRGGNLEDK